MDFDDTIRVLATIETPNGDRASLLSGSGGTIEIRIDGNASRASFSGLDDLLSAGRLLRTLPAVDAIGGRSFRALAGTYQSGRPAPLVIERIDGADAGPALLPDTLDPVAAVPLPDPDLRLLTVDVTDVWADGIALAGSRAIAVFLCDMSDQEDGVVLHTVLGAELRSGRGPAGDESGYEMRRRARFDRMDVRLKAPSIRFTLNDKDGTSIRTSDLPAAAILDSVRLPPSFLHEPEGDLILGCADRAERRCLLDHVAFGQRFHGLGAAARSTIWQKGVTLASRLAEPRPDPSPAPAGPPEGFSAADVGIAEAWKGSFDVVWKDRRIGKAMLDRTPPETGGGIHLHSSIDSLYTRCGVGRRVYDLVDGLLASEGLKLSPSPNMTDVAQKFWAKRDPAAFAEWLERKLGPPAPIAPTPSSVHARTNKAVPASDGTGTVVPPAEDAAELLARAKAAAGSDPGSTAWVERVLSRHLTKTRGVPVAQDILQEAGGLAGGELVVRCAAMLADEKLSPAKAMFRSVPNMLKRLIVDMKADRKAEDRRRTRDGAVPTSEIGTAPSTVVSFGRS